MKVLITGAQGMLGIQLVNVFRLAGHEVFPASHSELDITNRDQVFVFITKLKPDVVINAAAYNFVDKVEDREMYPLAQAINSDGPRFLAEVAKAIGALIVHFSTDYVFDGLKSDGYREDDEPNPLSKYGQTKLAGEIGVKEMTDNYYIIRLAKLFGKPGSGEHGKESFPALMMRLANEKSELTIIDEETSTPSYAPDVARATLEIIEEDAPLGVYHLVNEGEPVTWYGFAKEIFDITKSKTLFYPVKSADFNARPAKRPANSALKNTKFKKLRSRIEALEEFIYSDRSDFVSSSSNKL